MSHGIGTLIILGAGGDLTARLLLPGLGQWLQSSRGHNVELLGVGYDPMTDADWRARVTAAFAAGGASAAVCTKLAARTRYLQADVTLPDDLERVLGEAEGTPALYFALPPKVTIAACAALGKIEIPEGLVLALEKPFGTDLRSAKTLNRQLLKLVPESQIHRVDHFLGKSTVLNILGLRFANRIFEPIWRADHIESVEIVFDETLALEGRAGYYDKAGALVDMIQSHLLLVMAVVAMEPPSSVEADDLRGAMTQALRGARVWKGDAVTGARRARYRAGTIDGRTLPAYADEKGVDPKSETETLAEVMIAIDNWRWAGVPFVLRSGKALATRRQEIVITFRPVPHRPDGLTGDPGPARLRISLSPDTISLDLNINGEGDPFSIGRVSFDADFAGGDLGPYGEVLNGILTDDSTLSVGAEEVEECWRIVGSVLSAWRRDAVPIQTYAAGSAGPSAWKRPLWK
ncbi:glucose-6-phosphate dehydrogenase [Lacisediminihabitans changchengi]|uniref:Glucose-6-phosphate 1-dehydrogenase n=1 Tax=Lacisediminihabitans changchengi TaxID=2787634 RepID=A0A934SH77_9MICO|nr:glucose-6-phosphate dehydrogenase [Lacisediminihabitans changchengi]MBK4346566.1 glucose-6-phosphate dehydrogenase [Lacisediminihabitans changchengi]